MNTAKLERAYRAFVRCHQVVAAATDEAQLLRDVCVTAVNELGFRLASLELNLGASGAHARIAPLDLERILINLVVNASHASVSDAGKGIAPDVLPRIFEPFFTTKGELGTGLGLPSVAHLARAVGGGVSVESKPGQARGSRSSFRRSRWAPDHADTSALREP
ncbi:MAG: ATP-binding protein [Polyangiaceae bacterium]|nr:ATP-binding protein [Polyangiaceae bacterium]